MTNYRKKIQLIIMDMRNEGMEEDEIASRIGCSKYFIRNITMVNSPKGISKIYKDRAENREKIYRNRIASRKKMKV